MSKPEDDPPPGGGDGTHAPVEGANPSIGPSSASNSSAAAIVALTGVWEGSSTPFNKIKACGFCTGAYVM